MERDDIADALLRGIADGRGWTSATHVGALGVDGEVTPARLAQEVLRLRGIIEGARHFLSEDMTGCAAIMLCGTGLEGGIDPTLTDTPEGRRAIHEIERLLAVEEAARALCAELTTDCLPAAGTRWQEARALRDALAALDAAEPRPPWRLPDVR